MKPQNVGSEKSSSLQEAAIPELDGVTIRAHEFLIESFIEKAINVNGLTPV